MKGRSPTPISYGPDGKTLGLTQEFLLNNARSNLPNNGSGSAPCNACLWCLQDLKRQVFHLIVPNPKNLSLLSQDQGSGQGQSLVDRLRPPEHPSLQEDGKCSICQLESGWLQREAVRQVQMEASPQNQQGNRIQRTASGQEYRNLRQASSKGFYTNQQASPTLTNGYYTRTGSKPNLRSGQLNSRYQSQIEMHQQSVSGTKHGYHRGQINSSSTSGGPDGGSLPALTQHHGSNMRNMQPSSTQMAAAASFFARAGQKLHTSSSKKKRKNSHGVHEINGVTLTTSFGDVLRLTQPQVPPALLKSANSATPRGHESSKVKVMLRLRHLETGKGSDAASCVTVDQNRRQVTLLDPGALAGYSAPSQRRTGSSAAAPKMFALDAVFNEDDPLTELCATALPDIVQSVVSGTDGCVFGFGHSKLGKTYTMVGSDSSASTLGVIPCSIAWLFRLISEQKERTGARFSVRVSAVEVYGKEEQLKDLLAHVAHVTEASGQTAPGVYLREDPISGTQVENQSELRAPTADKAAFYLDAALASRTTCVGEEEERMSHLLFTLHLYQYRVEKSGTGSGVAGGRSRLHLLDLGCGRSSKESSATCSSLSLPAMASVLLALVTGQRHIPHRDSKLSQLLREAMGSLSCRSCMIAHISSNIQHYNESLQVVQLASKIHRMRRRRGGKLLGGGGSGGNCTTSSDDSSSCDSFGIRRAGRPRPQMGLLRCSALTSSEADYTSSSEQSCDTVIYLGRGGDMTDGESPPPLLTSNRLKALSSGESGNAAGGGAIPVSVSVTTPSGRKSGSESDTSVSSSQRGKTTRSPLLGKKIAPRTNAFAWPRAAVKNAIETLSTQREQWVDGPKAVYEGDGSQMNQNEIEKAEDISQPVPKSLPKMPTTEKESAADNTETASYAVLNSNPSYSVHTTSSSSHSHNHPHSKPPPAQASSQNHQKPSSLQHTQEKINPDKKIAQTISSRLMIDKETQSEEAYESGSSTTTSSYSTLDDRPTKRVLSDISERTEETDAGANSTLSSREDGQLGTKWASMDLDGIEPPPLSSACGTQTLESFSMCATMGSIDTTSTGPRNTMDITADYCSKQSQTSYSQSIPQQTSVSSSTPISTSNSHQQSYQSQPHSRHGNTSTTDTPSSTQIYKSSEQSTPYHTHAKPITVGSVHGTNQGSIAMTTPIFTTTNASILPPASSGPGEVQVARVKPFVRDWVEKHSVIPAGQPLHSGVSEEVALEKANLKLQNFDTIDEKSFLPSNLGVPVVDDSEPFHNKMSALRSSGRHHGQDGRKHHRTRKTSLTHQIILPQTPTGTPTPTPTNFARVAEWVQSVKLESVVQSPTDDSSLAPTSQYQQGQRPPTVGLPTAQQQPVSRRIPLGPSGSLDRATAAGMTSASGIPSGVDTAALVAASVPTDHSSVDSSAHDSRRGKSVPPRSIGSELEAEHQRVWFTAKPPGASGNASYYHQQQQMSYGPNKAQSSFVSESQPPPASVCLTTSESSSIRPASLRRPDGASNPHLHKEPSVRSPDVINAAMKTSGKRQQSHPLTSQQLMKMMPPSTKQCPSVPIGVPNQPSVISYQMEQQIQQQQQPSKPSGFKAVLFSRNKMNDDPCSTLSSTTTGCVSSSSPKKAAKKAAAQQQQQVTTSVTSSPKTSKDKESKKRSASASPVSHASSHSSCTGGQAGDSNGRPAASKHASLKTTSTFVPIPVLSSKEKSREKSKEKKEKSKEGKTKETRSRLSFLMSPLFGKKRDKRSNSQSTTVPPPVVAPTTTSKEKQSRSHHHTSSSSKHTKEVQGQHTSHHKHSSSHGHHHAGAQPRSTKHHHAHHAHLLEKDTTRLASPYTTVTQPRQPGGPSEALSSSGQGSECSGSFFGRRARVALLGGGGGVGGMAGIAPVGTAVCAYGCVATEEGGIVRCRHRRPGGHASSGYESMLRDSSEVSSSHNDSTSESSVSGVQPACSPVTEKKKETSSSSSSRRSRSAPPRSEETSEDTQSPASVRRMSPKVWSLDPEETKRRCAEEVEEMARQIRYEKIYDLLAQQDILKQELMDAKDRLMIEPTSWSFDLYVTEQMDPDDSGFLEALEKETEILRKRVDACKSHILMVTTFDVKPSIQSLSSTSCLPLSSALSATSCGMPLTIQGKALSSNGNFTSSMAIQQFDQHQLMNSVSSIGSCVKSISSITSTTAASSPFH